MSHTVPASAIQLERAHLTIQLRHWSPIEEKMFIRVYCGSRGEIVRLDASSASLPNLAELRIVCKPTVRQHSN